MDEESLVLRVGQHLVEKGLARRLFLVEGVVHTHTGVDQQAERQRQVRVYVEVLDSLGARVFEQGEVVFREIGDDLSLLVADGDRQGNNLYINRKSSGRSRRLCG